MKNVKQNLIITIIAITVASASVYYATAGIFKTNTQVVNDLTSGLVGYWTFDGQDTSWGANTTSDMSTNSNTGTMINMSTSSSPVDGKIGSAMDFDGSDDYITVSDNASLDITTALSGSAWINTDDIDNYISIYAKYNSITLSDQRSYWWGLAPT